MVLRQDASGDRPEERAPRRGVGRLLWEELLLPVGVVAGLLFIAVALIEGAPLQQFLYAVF
ncbi:MAG: hypothetical protein ACYTG2_10670 [Planctomycetota bacterium]